jgi:hypothetical protein
MLAKISTVACAALMLCASIPALEVEASPMRRGRSATTSAVPPITIVNQVAAPVNVNVQNNIAVGVGAPATATGGNLTNNNGVTQTATVPATSSGFNYSNQRVVPTNINVQNNIVYGVAGGSGKALGGNLLNGNNLGQTIKK